MLKPKTSFPRKIPELLEFARNVKTSLTTNVLFGNVPPEFARLIALLGEQIDKLQHTYDDAKIGGSDRKAARDAASADLTATLQKLAKHLELYADGDGNVMTSSGFEISLGPSAKRIIPTLLDALDVKVYHGPETGMFIAKGKPIWYALSYEAHITTGDPTVEENWGHYAFYPRPGHMVIVGRTPGQSYSIRFRVVTPKGNGPWSATHTLISL